MSENQLKLNPDKTELIVFGAKDRHEWLSDSFPVNILGNCLSPADVVCNLGLLFDAKFCFTNHINSVIKSCFISLRDLHRIMRFLSVDASVVIANALSVVVWIIAMPEMLQGSNMFKMPLHGLSLVLQSTLTLHPPLGHFIGYPLDNVLSLKP